MIARTYFYKLKWMHNNGSASYRYTSGFTVHKSWRKDPVTAFNLAKEEFIQDSLKLYPNGMLEVGTFNLV